MRNLEWEQYYNEFSRTQGRQAQGNGFLFRVLPSEGLVQLKLINSYTGEEKKVNFADLNEAISSATKINEMLGAGHDIKTILGY